MQTWTAILGLLFLTKYEVYRGISISQSLAVKSVFITCRAYCRTALRHETVTSLQQALSVKGWIIEGVSGNGYALLTAVTVAETSRVVVGPRDVTTEFLHRADIRDKFLVGHAIIVCGKESGEIVVAAGKVIRGAETVEAIDDEHGLHGRLARQSQ